MEAQFTQKIIHELLDKINVSVNGKNPWDIKINHPHFYNRVASEGALGLGEGYMDNWWECEALDHLFERIVEFNLENAIKKNPRLIFKLALAKFTNWQTKKRAFIVGQKHYDLGLPLFEYMLDSRKNYTCGYWKNASNLDDAQLAKLKLVCEKLMLKPGMRVLDIGCGFGALAKYAAENYDVSVVGITVSKDQQEYAQRNCANLPVDIRLQDYREVNETFDRVVSLGMFEHVGHLNYDTYMKKVHQCLKNDGIFLLHTIGNNVTAYRTNDWIEKYIFPNGMLPSIQLIGKAIEPYFIMEDWHNFGADYDKTLLAWFENFNKHWSELRKYFDDRFYRMWKYYLLTCAGGFRARGMQLWQIVLTKSPLKGGYQAVR